MAASAIRRSLLSESESAISSPIVLKAATSASREPSKARLIGSPATPLGVAVRIGRPSQGGAGTIAGLAVRTRATLARHFSHCVSTSIKPREARHFWWYPVHTKVRSHLLHISDISLYDMSPSCGFTSCLLIRCHPFPIDVPSVKSLLPSFMCKYLSL